jgi:hypothetical protein
MAHDRPGPARLLVARISGIATRHSQWREPTESETAAAVADLRGVAGDRLDLLAEVAGILLGASEGRLDGQLTSTAEPTSQPAAGLTSQPATGGQLAGQRTAAIAITADGEPCPGVACSGPGCWNRDTSRYGLRRLVLCTACAVALQGHEYKRETPESAARGIRRGAA